MESSAAVIAGDHRKWASHLARLGLLAYGLSMLVLAAHRRRPLR